MNAPSFNLHSGDAVRVGSDWWEVIHRSRNEVALRLSGTFTTRTFSNGVKRPAKLPPDRRPMLTP